MNERFTLLIDESGEAGIGRIRSEYSGGASPYMTLGAAVITNRSKQHVESSLKSIACELGKASLHCSNLKHYQLLYFIRKITQQRFRLFGLVSRKATLGNYRSKIDQDSGKYYNKCVQYLLERVGFFMEIHAIPPENLDIVFEKANHDYEQMFNFLKSCQANPKHPNTERLNNIDVDRTSVKKKADEPLLQLGDLVAHALYKCVDKTTMNFGIPEPRYLRELGPSFFGNPETRAVLGAGIYCVHKHTDLQLDADVEKVITSLVADPPR